MTSASGPRVVGPKIVLAKPGLDGHDRGVKVVAMALRDAGAEVVYLGLQQSPAQIAAAAAAEDADLIGVSILSGVHLAVTTELLDACRAHGLSGVPVVVGGTIPPADIKRLLDLGVRDVFPVGSPLANVVARIHAITSQDPPQE